MGRKRGKAFSMPQSIKGSREAKNGTEYPLIIALMRLKKH